MEKKLIPKGTLPVILLILGNLMFQTCPLNIWRSLSPSDKCVNIPDPRDKLPVCSTSVIGLNEVVQKKKEEIRPKGQPTLLPPNPP